MSDPYWGNVVFLSGFEGGTIVDESDLAQTVTTYGTTAASSAQARFGTQSLALPASGDAGVSVPDHASFTFGTADFTVECWIRITASSTEYRTVLAHNDTNAPGGWELIYRHDTDELTFTVYSTGDYTTIGGSGLFDFALDTWYHLAADFDGTKYRLYVDGTMIGSDTYLLTIANPSVPLAVGSRFNTGSPANGFHDGYIDEARITVGVARYASDSGFTPPSAALPRGPVVPDPPGYYSDTLTERMQLNEGGSHNAAAALLLDVDQPRFSLATTEATARITIQTILDTLGVSPLPTAVLAQLVTSTETINISLSTLATQAPVVLEILALAQSQLPSLISSEQLSDGVSLTDASVNGYGLALSDAVNLAAVLDAAKGAVILEQLGLLEVFETTATYNVSQAERVRLGDVLARFLGGSIAESLTLTLAGIETFQPAAGVAEQITLAAAVTPMLIIRVAANDEIELAATEVLSGLYSGTLSETLTFSGGLLSPDGSFTTWAMNTRTAAVSEYSNYAFNSMAMLDGRPIGANSEGLYELVGDDDAGTAIVSRMRGGYLQFGGPHLSRLNAAYIATRGDAGFVLRIETGDGAVYNYNVDTRSMRSAKVHMGKGQRARYFSFELISDGGDFDLDTLEFIPIVVQRRV